MSIRRRESGSTRAERLPACSRECSIHRAPIRLASLRLLLIPVTGIPQITAPPPQLRFSSRDRRYGAGTCRDFRLGNLRTCATGIQTDCIPTIGGQAGGTITHTRTARAMTLELDLAPAGFSESTRTFSSTGLSTTVLR